MKENYRLGIMTMCGRFGLNAPRGITINREEIYKRKQEKLKQNEKSDCS